MDGMTRNEFFANNISPIRVDEVPGLVNQIQHVLRDNKTCVVGSAANYLEPRNPSVLKVGDIDIALLLTDPRQSWRITSRLSEYGLTYYDNTGLGIIHVLFPDHSSVGTDFRSSFYQVDIILTDDLDYVQFSRFSPPRERRDGIPKSKVSQYGGVYRNLALFSLAKFHKSDLVLETERLWFDVRLGLLKGSLLDIRGVTKRLVTKDPSKICEYLLGSSEIATRFEDCIPALRKNKSAMHDFVFSCTKHKLEIPVLGAVVNKESDQNEEN